MHAHLQCTPPPTLKPMYHPSYTLHLCIYLSHLSAVVPGAKRMPVPSASVPVYKCVSVQMCNCAIVQLCISQRSHFTTHPISPTFLPLTIAPLRNSSSILFPANISLTSLKLLSFTICETLMYEGENTKASLAAFCEP